MPEARGVMIVAETGDAGLASVTAELAGIGSRLAAELAQPFMAVLVGAGVETQLGDLAALGAERVFVADADSLTEYEPDHYLAVLESAVNAAQPSLLLLAQTPTGRDLAGRAAFRLGTALSSDCTALRVEDGRVVMTKPVYGGNAKAEYVVKTSPQIATIRPRAFEPAQPSAKRAEVVRLEPPGVSPRLEIVETVKEEASEGPRLKDAKKVVTGGRGLGGPENWPAIESLAETLGAAVGATRAVTDAGWVPPTMQVGLTGVTISPDLYITVAVSGAVQHIAGCSGARNIIAINKDPEANIFKHARYGVVGDWKQVLPAFTAKIKELLGR